MGAAACCHEDSGEDKEPRSYEEVATIASIETSAGADCMGDEVVEEVTRHLQVAEKADGTTSADLCTHGITPSPSEAESTSTKEAVLLPMSNGAHNRTRKRADSEPPSYLVNVDRHGGDKLGMVVGIILDTGHDLKRPRRRVKVKAVVEGGAVWAWNEKHPSLPVEKGYFITEVEGYTDPVEIVEHFAHLTGQTVAMHVRPPAA
mmetsp:Transcript_65844/g.122857  ORF Transcript_65844/g.122857 Transcript_65844/m.122857 type:complete len:204 (+) Transcript_65844:110-721(+)